MTQEDKELLRKELSARYPYDVKLQVRLNYGDSSHKEGIYDAEIDAITSYNLEVTYYDTNMGGKARDWTFMYEEVKPYLRPMSSMTEEEKKEWYKESCVDYDCEFQPTPTLALENCHLSTDWLNAHHFDYRGLIEKGLALVAPKDMYDSSSKVY